MTQIVGLGGIVVSNRIGFKRKSLNGQWRDFKAMCARAGLMDVYRKIRDSDYHPGTSGLRAMMWLTTQPDARERLLARLEWLTEMVDSKTLQAGRYHAYRQSQAGVFAHGVSGRDSSKSDPAALEPPDPFV